MGSRWTTLLAIDFDAHAVACYRANFPGVACEHGPVAQHIDMLPEADVILGGPPCQPFSTAGEGKGDADERDCIPDFLAAVRRVRPRMFLMENVPGLLSEKHSRYIGGVVTEMESAGYAVDVRELDAVNFGVPQFRNRVFFWGIRADVYDSGVRHAWPRASHVWPPPPVDGLFGAEHHLLAGVTVREALGVDGWLQKDTGAGFVERGGERRIWTTDEPSQTVTADHVGGAGCRRTFIPRVIPTDALLISGSKCRKDNNGEPRGPLVKDLDNPSYTIDSTPPSVRVMGGGRNHPADENGYYQRDKRDITDEPSTTVVDLNGATTPTIEYRWSDAMLQKHPPANPEPSSTVQAKWFKGGAEGLLAVKWTRKGEIWVRRLSPLECARLQSVPDCYVWPKGITKTVAYRVVGNGWASLMGKRLGEALAAADPKSRTVIDLFCGGGLGAVGWHGAAWEYLPAESEVA